MRQIMTKLTVGAIVTVIHQGWRFTGKQGRVVEIIEDGNEDGPVGVIFPNYYGRLLDYPYKPGDAMRFQEADLKEITRGDLQDITMEQICDILFGRMWHNVSTIQQPLMVGFGLCMHVDCEKLVMARILVNCHGSVAEFDVCNDHMHYHGRNNDGFPCRKDMDVAYGVNVDKLVKAMQEA
jgi:hypothetical protein